MCRCIYVRCLCGIHYISMCGTSVHKTSTAATRVVLSYPMFVSAIFQCRQHLQTFMNYEDHYILPVHLYNCASLVPVLSLNATTDRISPCGRFCAASRSIPRRPLSPGQKWVADITVATPTRARIALLFIQSWKYPNTTYKYPSPCH